MKNIDKVGRFLIQLQTAEGEILYFNQNSDEFDYFRYKTTNSNEILTMPVLHFVSNRKTQKYFGIPQVISIGTWYS